MDQWGRPLEETLTLTSVGVDVYLATLPGFGAVTLGCAALAAGRTCDGRALHSLHAYFMRPVTSEIQVEFVVERVRDGRRVALRRVQARVEDRVLFEMTASFTSPGEGADFQDAVAPTVPAPETLTPDIEIAREEGWRPGEPSPVGGPFEWRWPEIPWRLEGGDAPSYYEGWVRPRFPMPEDTAFNGAALAYASDYHSHMSVARRLGGHFVPWGYTSLDQVVWVHRDLHWSDWRLMTTECDAAYGGRALSRRRLYTREGILVASMLQEQLIPSSQP